MISDNDYNFMSKYRLKIVEHFDWVRNQVDLYSEKKILLAQKSIKEYNEKRRAAEEEYIDDDDDDDMDDENENEDEDVDEDMDDEYVDLTKKEAIEQINSERNKILNELSKAEETILIHLEKLNMNELESLSENERQLGEKIFKIFCFAFQWRFRLRLVVVEDFYLTRKQISYLKRVINIQELDMMDHKWWPKLFKNLNDSSDVSYFFDILILT